MNVSVVMTTYNGEKYLDQQIQSILNQTLKPVEFIVCDDLSTDGTISILEKYRQGQKLVYFINEQRLGPVRNFKKAVSLASKNNYIALSDQDDEWLPEKLEKSAKLLKKIDFVDKPCMVYTDLYWVNEDGTLINPSFRNERGQDHYELNLETLMYNNFVNGCSTLFNPQLAHLFADFPDNIPYHDVWMAFLSLTFGNAAQIAEPLIWYRKHGNNASVSGDVKPKSRYISNIKEVFSSITGSKDFLDAEFATTRKFYEHYNDQMTPDKKLLFENFLKNEHKPYLVKKLAYRNTLKKYKF